MSPVPVMSELADVLEENYKLPFHTLVLYFLLLFFLLDRVALLFFGARTNAGESCNSQPEQIDDEGESSVQPNAGESCNSQPDRDAGESSVQPNAGESSTNSQSEQIDDAGESSVQPNPPTAPLHMPAAPPALHPSMQLDAVIAANHEQLEPFLQRVEMASLERKWQRWLKQVPLCDDEPSMNSHMARLNLKKLLGYLGIDTFKDEKVTGRRTHRDRAAVFECWDASYPRPYPKARERKSVRFIADTDNNFDCCEGGSDIPSQWDVPLKFDSAYREYVADDPDQERIEIEGAVALNELGGKYTLGYFSYMPALCLSSLELAELREEVDLFMTATPKAVVTKSVVSWSCGGQKRALQAFLSSAPSVTFVARKKTLRVMAMDLNLAFAECVVSTRGCESQMFPRVCLLVQYGCGLVEWSLWIWQRQLLGVPWTSWSGTWGTLISWILVRGIPKMDL